jgi:hypothetical protein
MSRTPSIAGRWRPVPILLALAFSPPCPAGDLFPHATYPVGGVPYGLVVGDFNADGRPDVAAATYDGLDVSVHLGTGGGRLGPKTSFGAGEPHLAIALGDLDGDGRQDLVTGTRYGQVAVLLGNGDGTFAPRGLFPSICPVALAVADFDGDGWQDVATSGSCNGDVEIFAGNGDGTLDPPSLLQMGGGGGNYGGLRADDLDSDGRADLAAADPNQHDIWVRLGNGDGTFGAAAVHDVGLFAASIAVDDFNGDGARDLAVAGYPGVAVLFGNGDGGFAVVPIVAAPCGWFPIASGDLNADGKPDLAHASGCGVLLGNGDGTFELLPAAGVADTWYDLRLADMDVDGRVDLVGAAPNSGDLVVLMGQGDGTFATEKSLGGLDAPMFVTGEDFDRDGLGDLALVEQDLDRLSIRLGNGDGSFGAPAFWSVADAPGNILVGDWNRDLRSDLAVSGTGVSMFFGDGSGSFTAGALPLAGTAVRSSVALDANRDGLQDLAALLASNEVAVLLGAGDGSFPSPAPTTSLGPDPATAIAAGDLDGDGDGDLGVAVDRTGAPGELRVLLAAGDGTFAAPVSYGVGEAPAAVVIRDLDADGTQDVAVANNLDDTVSILLGNGDGTLRPETRFASRSSGPFSLAAEDFDADGRLDLAVSNEFIHRASVLLGNGDGTFRPPTSFGTGEFPASLAALDLNGDALPDLAVAAYTAAWQSASITLLLSTGDRSRGPCADGDLDGYGRPGSLLCPAGASADCDDLDAGAHPGGVEVCDGADNDCDGFADGPFDDADGDGRMSCAGDCNDFDPNTYSGAGETNDGRDNGCPGEPGFGLADELGAGAGFPGGGDPSAFCWPAQPGATGYEVLRSAGPLFPAGCSRAVTAGTCWSDPEMPTLGGVLHYVARALRPRAGTFGARSSGVERADLCGEETTCNDQQDDDGDGAADCADPGCFGRSICLSRTLSFLDTAADDVAAAAIGSFFSEALLWPSDHLRVSVGGATAADLDECLERADFYGETYLALAATAGSAPSGAWSKWYREEAGGWIGPTTASFWNGFGDDCVGPFSWCVEPSLGGRGLGFDPAAGAGLCEGFDTVCGDGTWTFTIRLGVDRLAACGF